MFIWLAAFSLLAGMITPLIASVTFVLAFSAVAATACALLMLVFGGGWGMAALVWLTTIFAMQVGFALSTLLITITGKRTGSGMRDPARKRSILPLSGTAPENQALVPHSVPVESQVRDRRGPDDR